MDDSMEADHSESTDSDGEEFTGDVMPNNNDDSSAHSSLPPPMALFSKLSVNSALPSEMDDATTIATEVTRKMANTTEQKIKGRFAIPQNSHHAPDSDPCAPVDKPTQLRRRQKPDEADESQNPPLPPSRSNEKKGPSKMTEEEGGGIEFSGVAATSKTEVPTAIQSETSGKQIFNAFKGMINQSTQTLSSRMRRPEKDLDSAKQPARRLRRRQQPDPSEDQPRRPKSHGKDPNQPFVKLLNFQNIQECEQKRRPEYVVELQTITEEWNECRHVLQRLEQEVHHANHLFQISENSFHQFAATISNIQKDCFLDEKGDRVLSSAKQLLLQQQREPHKASIENGYLNPMFQSFSVMSNQLMKTVLDHESNATTKHAAAQEFYDFSEELLAQADAMKALGDSIFQELCGSETDIQNAYNVLEQLASRIKSRNVNALAGVFTDFFASEKQLPDEMEYAGLKAPVGDWWLWETLYYAAVTHEESTWEDNKEKMKGLQESLKYFEDKHEKMLREAVLAVMPEQRQMFAIGGRAFEAALQRTVNSSSVANEAEQSSLFDHDKFAKEFEQGLQKRSNAYLQAKHHHRSAIMNRARTKYNPGTQMAEGIAASTHHKLDEELPAFGSPVLSQLVHRSQVLERWIDNEWSTTIAVLTVDRFLHLFDCSDLNTKTIPQTAWACMFPTTATTRTSAHYQGRGRKRASRATQHTIPTPTFCFNLVMCQFQTYEYSRRSFEIKQEYEAGGQKSKTQPHAHLRFRDFEEASHWFALLRNIPKGPNFQNFEDPLSPGEGNPYQKADDEVADGARKRENHGVVLVEDPDQDDLEVFGGDMEDNMADLDDFASDSGRDYDENDGNHDVDVKHDYSDNGFLVGQAPVSDADSHHDKAALNLINQFISPSPSSEDNHGEVMADDHDRHQESSGKEEEITDTLKKPRADKSRDKKKKVKYSDLLEC
mgnify:CR=1 FL=1